MTTTIEKTQLVWIPASVFTGFRYDESSKKVKQTTLSANAIHILEVSDKEPSFGDTVLTSYSPFYKQYELGDEGDVIINVSSLEPGFVDGYVENRLYFNYIIDRIDTIKSYTELLPFEEEYIVESKHILVVDSAHGYGEYVSHVTLSDTIRKFIIYCINEIVLPNLQEENLNNYMIIQSTRKDVNETSVLNRSTIINSIKSLELCKKIQRELVFDKFGVLYELLEPEKDCAAYIWFSELHPNDTSVYVYNNMNVYPTYIASRFPSEIDYAITMLKESLFIPIEGFVK